MPESVSLTPLLEQYEGVKARYPGHLVLFRVGDFYETLGDDARLLSREVDVVLTARSADAQGVRTPMAGVPHHSVETYLGRLVRKGYKVAICDQVEDPRLAKGLVRREVTRVVTPGTVVEDRILGGPDHSFLASVVAPAQGVGAYAAVDVTPASGTTGSPTAPARRVSSPPSPPSSLGRSSIVLPKRRATRLFFPAFGESFLPPGSSRPPKALPTERPRNLSAATPPSKARFARRTGVSPPICARPSPVSSPTSRSSSERPGGGGSCSTRKRSATSRSTGR